MAHTTPRLIDRGDLLSALDRAAARTVTIISAPAGSGKTSLLRAWADRQGERRRLAILQVQRDQQDAQQFWLALLDAVCDASAATGRAGPPAGTPEFNAPAMVDRVLAELADASPGVTLVIDDLHELNSPEALAQLTRLLTNLPPGAHAMLTTRHDLRLGLHQLRLAGELAEIRATDLRFTERETRLLLDASGIALSESGAALLHQRTEGWAAGLRLAVQHLGEQVLGDHSVAAGELRDETLGVGVTGQGDRREPQARGPPFCSLVQQRCSGFGQRDARGVEQVAGFIPGKAQVGRADLGQLAGQAQLVQAQPQIVARGQDRVRVQRKVRQQPGELSERRWRGQLVQIIDHQRDAAASVGELRQQPAGHRWRVEVRCPGRRFRAAVGTGGPPDRIEQGQPELLGVLLVALHLQHGEAARLRRTARPGAQQRRLTAAGRSRDDRHLPR